MRGLSACVCACVWLHLFAWVCTVCKIEIKRRDNKSKVARPSFEPPLWNHPLSFFSLSFCLMASVLAFLFQSFFPVFDLHPFLHLVLYDISALLLLPLASRVKFSHKNLGFLSLIKRKTEIREATQTTKGKEKKISTCTDLDSRAFELKKSMFCVSKCPPPSKKEGKKEKTGFYFNG